MEFSMPEASHKKNFSLAIRIAGTILSTALFVLLISRQKWEVVLEKATGISHWVVALSLGFYLVSYGFNTLRWCILLWAQSVRIPFTKAYSITWAGNFASNFLPSTIGGDGFRMLAINPYTQKKTISIGSVVLDRIINMSAMACLIPAPLIMFGESLKLLINHTRLSSVGLPAGLTALFEKYSPKIVHAFKIWANRPWILAQAFLVAWPSNLFAMGATYAIAIQLDMHVNFWQVISVQTVTYFLSVLPISVNGYGLREVTYTTLYTLLGASVEQASALALITRLMTVLSTVPGALWLSAVVSNAAGLDESNPEE